MNLSVPARFSVQWWFVIAGVTVVIGSTVFLFLRFETGLGLGQIFVYWLVITFIGDVITAISMEAVAPTRVTIGPGDRRFDADVPAESGVVVSTFTDSGVGRVKIRGEVWSARSTGDPTHFTTGMQVRVVGRDGLTLLVVADGAQQPPN